MRSYNHSDVVSWFLVATQTMWSCTYLHVPTWFEGSYEVYQFPSAPFSEVPKKGRCFATSNFPFSLLARLRLLKQLNSSVSASNQAIGIGRTANIFRWICFCRSKKGKQWEFYEFLHCGLEAISNIWPDPGDDQYLRLGEDKLFIVALLAAIFNIHTCWVHQEKHIKKHVCIYIYK